MSDRKMLKEYFKSGKTPTEKQFADLIDSVPNIEEDGVVRTELSGIAFYPRDENTPVATFYEQGAKYDVNSATRVISVSPCWTITIGKKKEFVLTDEKGNVIVSIEQDRIVPLYEKREVVSELPVDDHKKESLQTVYLQMAADGYWHDLPVEAAIKKERFGCRVYRVFAVYQRGGKGCYRMVEAIVSHCNGRHLRLSSSEKRWSGWRGPIRLRWDKRDEGLFLQMCGRRKDRALIRYQISEIWSYTDSTN